MLVRLAQSYIHLKPFTVSDGDIERLGERAVTVATEAAKATYDFDVQLEIDLEPGSLKAWVLVLSAGIGVAYNAIATWPDFKQGLTELVQDAREFGGGFNRMFADEAKAQSNQVYRTERRTMTPGKILRAASRIERAEAGAEARRAAHELYEALEEVPAGEAQQITDLIANNNPEFSRYPSSRSGPYPIAQRSFPHLPYLPTPMTNDAIVTGQRKFVRKVTLPTITKRK